MLPFSTSCRLNIEHFFSPRFFTRLAPTEWTRAHVHVRATVTIRETLNSSPVLKERDAVNDPDPVCRAKLNVATCNFQSIRWNLSLRLESIFVFSTLFADAKRRNEMYFHRFSARACIRKCSPERANSLILSSFKGESLFEFLRNRETLFNH